MTIVGRLKGHFHEKPGFASMCLASKLTTILCTI